MGKKIGVIGAGSAGVLSLVHLCTWLDNSWDIVSIHNPKKPILGIGESTNGGFVGLLERGLNFCLGHPEDMAALDATLKFGSKFMEWREHSWINPLLDGNTAIHFNNFLFNQFAFKRLPQLWPKKYSQIEGDVTAVKNEPDKVVVTIDGQDHEFDYLMDCMGFPQAYDNYTMSDCSPVNRAWIHSLMPDEFTYEPYTDHIATKGGWMFGVPLQSRKTFGYMYNDTITDPAEAKADMLRILGAKELDAATGRGIQTAEYKFRCYYSNSIIEGRVGKNGNKALFFEPLIANSIFLYIYTVRLFYDFVLGHAQAHQANAAFIMAVNQMEDTISYYYQGGSRHDSDFWRYAVPFATQRVQRRQPFQEALAHYRHLKDNGILHHGPDYAFAPKTWELVDEALGYGYIDESKKRVHIGAGA